MGHTHGTDFFRRIEDASFSFLLRATGFERSDTSRSTLPTQEWGGNQVARDLWDRAPRGEPVDAYGADYDLKE